MSYSDELSLHLSAKDEMSAKVRQARKQMSGLEQDMRKARRQVADTGSEAAVAELRRLEKAWEAAAGEQARASKAVSEANRELTRLKKAAAGASEELKDTKSAAGRTAGAMGDLKKGTERAGKETKQLDSLSTRLGRALRTTAARATHLDGRMDKLSKTLGGTHSKMGKIGLVAGAAALGGVAALAAGAAAGAKGLWDLTKGAAEDEAAQIKLQRSLAKTAGATKEQVAGLEEWISKQGELTGFSDDQMRPSLERLAGSFGSIDEAKSKTKLAMDIATTKGMDLATVSKALAKANDGNVNSLKKLGITLGPQAQNLDGYNKAMTSMSKAQVFAGNVLERSGAKSKEYAKAQEKVAYFQDKANQFAGDGIDMFGELGKQFGGQTSAHAKTFEGRMDRLKLTLSETGESIGAGVLPYVTDFVGLILDKGIPAVRQLASKVMPTLLQGFTHLKGVIRENRPGLEKLAGVFGAVGKVLVTKVIPFIAKVQFKSWEVGIRVLAGAGDRIMAAAPGFLRFASTAVGAFQSVFDAGANAMSGLLNAAAKAFGGLPGMGWLRDAASGFDNLKSKTHDALESTKKGLSKAADGVEKWNRKAKKAEAARLKADVKDLTGKIADAKKKLKDPKLTKPEKTQLRADIKEMSAQVATAKRKLRDKALTDPKPTRLKADKAPLVRAVGDATARLDKLGRKVVAPKVKPQVALSQAELAMKRFVSKQWHLSIKGGFGGFSGGTVAGGGSAVARAMSTRTNKVGMCGATVGRWLGGKGPHGPSAITAWDRAPRRYKHPGDWHPPAGVPVYWRGGRYGHVALSLGGGLIRSTDWPHAGVTGTTTIEHLTRAWGKSYQGWARPFRHGGRVRGPGTETSDSIPARLSNGEFVLTARSARRIGYHRLDDANRSGRLPAPPPPLTPAATAATVQVGRVAPLVGSMTVHASSELDLEMVMARVARREARAAARTARPRVGV